MQVGVLTILAFIFVLYVIQGVDPEEFADQILKGIKNMPMPLVMVVLAFCFATACEEIMFIDSNGRSNCRNWIFDFRVYGILRDPY